MPLNFLSTKMAAWMTILVLAVGSISIVGTIQFVKGLDGANINGSIIACVYGACKDNTFNGGTSGGSQPTPNTATLVVTKELVGCGPPIMCQPNKPEGFTIKITGNNPSASTINDDGTGTKITIGPGEFTVTETPDPTTEGFKISFSGDCQQDAANSPSATGKISAGETKKCTVINTSSF